MKQLLSVLIFCPALLLAQSETATLRGIVRNASGEPLAKVPVSLAETTAALDTRSVTTDGGGRYEFPLLKPGVYKMTIEERGYQTYNAENISLDPGQVRRLDPQLTAGSPEDTVIARFGISTIDTQNGILRDIIDNKARWNDRPVVDKTPSPFPLLVTAPGVQGNGPNSLVINGISDRNRQTWQADGIADDARQGKYVNPLFFEFMQVTLANPGVDTYRPTGFDLISKRGTGALHGQVYYKRGSSGFDSRPYFATRENSYKLDEFGGDLGGHIISGWTYFYAGGVYQRNPFSQTLFADVPTDLMRVGNLVQFLDPATSPTGKVVVIRDPRSGNPFANNLIPPARISPVSTKIINTYYPSANLGGANTFLQNYSWTHNYGPDLYRGIWPLGRLDQKLWNGNNAYFRYMETRTSSIAAGSLGEILNSTQGRTYRSMVFGDSWALSPRVVNRLSLGRITDFVKQGDNEGKVTPITGDQVIQQTGIQGTNINGYTTAGFPTIQITGLTGLSMLYAGGQNNSVAQNDNLTTVEDGVVWAAGRHSLKFGALYTHMHWLEGVVPMNNYGSFTFTGQFTGNAYADFLLGYPATSSRILNPMVNSKLHQDQAGLYLADTVRLSSRLTVDLGVRWDYFNSPVYENGYMYNWDPATGNVIVAPGTITAVSSLYPKTVKVTTGNVVPKAKTTNFRPRVSAAYRLSDRTVIRGGYGEFTDSGGFGPFGRINDPNGPFRPTETYNNSLVNGVPLYTFPKPFPSTATPISGTLSITGLPTKTEEGVIRQYNATLEHVVSGIDVRLSYIGARGENLNYTLDINKPQAGTTAFSVSRLPYPQFGSAFYTRNDGKWRYDSAQVQALKRVGSLSFDTSFTWGDNRANYLNTYDPYHVTNKWSRDAADRRLYFVAAAMWDIPVGNGRRVFSSASGVPGFFINNWSLQFITTFASGQYFTPLFTGPDPANASAGFVTAPPDCVGDPTAGARTIGRWFNPTAFSIPPAGAGRYGTCGVNTLEGYPIHVGHASLAKRIPLGESLSAYFTVQVSNVTNTPHFLLPNNNISTPGAGAFTPASEVPYTYPERTGSRQLDLKLRFQW